MGVKKELQLNAATHGVAGEGPEIRLISMIGGVWACEDGADSPVVVLRRWRIYEVKLPLRDKRTRHIIGYIQALREGRVSSALKSFDLATMCGATESGRAYELQGPQGPRLGWGEAEYVWGRWKQLSEATDVVDVTEELLK